MISLGSLWLAILLSAVFVWIGSAIVWMVLPHHKKDYAKVPDEEAVRSAMSGIGPGTYMIPHATSPEEFKNPEFVSKMTEGPVGYFTIVPSGPPTMGGKLVMSFAFYLFVSFMVAYLASNFLEPGMEYMRVFRFASVTAWLAYGFAVIQDAVWFGRPWSQTLKHVFDAFIYALLTGGVFGWLWP